MRSPASITGARPEESRVSAPGEYAEGKLSAVYLCYTQFINNFDNYLKLFRERILVSGDAYQVGCFYELIDRLKAEDKLFSEYLPLPNRTLLIQERSDSTADMARIYMDGTMAAIFDAINGMRGIDHPVVAKPPRAKDVATAKFYLNITTAIVDYFDTILGSKPGKIRRSQCGSRGYATGRTVMAARTMPISPPREDPSTAACATPR